MATYTQSQNTDLNKATYGENSQGVAGLQNYLNSKGAGLTVDSKYGDKTKAAVAKFGLPTTGTPIAQATTATAITPQSLENQTPITVPAPLQSDVQDTATMQKTAKVAPQNFAEQALASLDVPQTKVQDVGDTLVTKIFGEQGKLAGQTEELAKQQELAGVDTKKQELQNINSQILQKTAEVNQSDIQLISNMRAEERRDTLLPFAQSGQAKLAGDATILRALKTSEIGVLNAQALAKQGDIALAKETAQQAVDVKYAPYKDNIATWEAQLKIIQPLLTRDEKKQADIQQIKGQLVMKEIDKVIDFQKTALSNALSNNAPQSVINKINSAHTIDEITSVGSNYITSAADKLDLQLKRARLQEINTKNQSNKEFVAPPLINPETGKQDPTSQLAKVIKKSGTKDNTNLQNILGVISATQGFAEKNPTGKFPAISLGGVGGSSFEKFAGPKGQSNLSNIEAINLKVQQWASGAALTDTQTKQVAKITPRSGDTNQQIRQKTNALADFMQNQARSLLATQGVDYKVEPIDYFSPPDGEKVIDNYLNNATTALDNLDNPITNYSSQFTR